jgi:hypothetical protein
MMQMLLTYGYIIIKHFFFFFFVNTSKQGTFLKKGEHNLYNLILDNSKRLLGKNTSK